MDKRVSIPALVDRALAPKTGRVDTPCRLARLHYKGARAALAGHNKLKGWNFALLVLVGSMIQKPLIYPGVEGGVAFELWAMDNGDVVVRTIRNLPGFPGKHYEVDYVMGNVHAV